MTQEELFDDLKQFIEATVSQQTAGLATGLQDVKQEVKGINARMTALEATVDQRFDSFDSKIDNLRTAIADTLTHAVEAVDAHEQVRDLQRRVTKLEHRTI